MSRTLRNVIQSSYQYFLAALAVATLGLVFHARGAGATPPPSWFDREALPGHRIQLLTQGIDTYNKRMELIKNAQRTIFLSGYAFEPDNAGMNIAYQLCVKAEAGLDVRMIVDNLGSKKLQGIKDQLLGCGIRIMFYAPWLWNLTDVAYVLHEKLLIVDGEQLIIGGSGYANKYYLASRTAKEWHDLDAWISGPAACWYHQKYMDNFRTTAKNLLRAARPDAMSSQGPGEDYEDYYFGLEHMFGCEAVSFGTAKVLPSYSNPAYSDKRPNLKAHLAAIAATPAGSRIRLYAPYFVPREDFMNALIAAARRGVDVTIITNSPWSSDDTKRILVAMYTRIRGLMDGGVKVRLWNRNNTMHRKGGIYGDQWAYFGSDNLDMRGQNYSSESISFTDDAQTVAAMNHEYDEDCKQTIPLTREFIKKDLSNYSSIDIITSHWIQEWM